MLWVLRRIAAARSPITTQGAIVLPVVTRGMIIDAVWDFDFDPGSNVVDVYINYLRRKIDSGHDRTLIRTIRGVGYQIGANVQSASPV